MPDSPVPGVPTTAPARWWQRRFTILVLLGSILAFALLAWFRPWQPFTPRSAPIARALVPQPVALAPGVYLLGKSAPAAVYLVETADGLVLIDSGLDDDAAGVTDQLAELQFEVGRLRAILLTHVHADHSLGAQQLRERTGARIYAGRDDCGPLRAGQPREAFFSTFHMPDRSPHPTTVDVELTGGEILTFGDTRIEVVATPGHTPGSVCFLLERTGLRALFAGDVVQHLDPAAPNALGTYTAYLPPLYRGNVRDWLTTLSRLRALPVPDLILPGHPQMDPAPQSPHLSPGRWHALLDGGIAEMERLLKLYETDGANFLDGLPKELLPGLHYLGAFSHRSLYVLDTSNGRFLFDAPGGPSLVDFLAKRFQKLGGEGRKLTAVLLTAADEEATAGLAALVQTTGCAVVAPKAGVENVRRRCPAGARVLTEDELEKSSWFEVKVIPLQGRGTAPMAYEVQWAGKTVLLSGRIPVKLDAPTGQQLLADLTGPGGNVDDYWKSLRRLEDLKPALWLPAVPVHGQNANLYDDDWERVLAKNRQLIAEHLLKK